MNFEDSSNKMQQFPDSEILSELLRRIVYLEKRRKTQDSRIVYLEKTVKTQDSRIVYLEKTVKTQDSRIVYLEKTVKTQEDRLSNVEYDVEVTNSNLKDRIEELEWSPNPYSDEGEANCNCNI